MMMMMIIVIMLSLRYSATVTDTLSSKHTSSFEHLLYYVLEAETDTEIM